MMNPTMFDPISLESRNPGIQESRNSDETSSQFLQSKLENYLQNYFPCFYSKPQRNLFQTFVRGLLSPMECKSIEPIDPHFSGEKYVRHLQQFFSRSPFDERPLLETYQELLSTQINAPGGMLSIDDTSFVKKGRHSAGVKRQYCDRLGKTENCQSGVFLAYAGDHGYGLADYQLYLPQEWFSESYSGLRKECHILEELDFSTKNEIGLKLIRRAFQSGRFHAQWIGCVAAYGCDHAFVDSRGLLNEVWYFAATNSKEKVFLEFPEMTFPETKRGRPRNILYCHTILFLCRKLPKTRITPGKLLSLQRGPKAPFMQNVNLSAASPAGKTRTVIM